MALSLSCMRQIIENRKYEEKLSKEQLNKNSARQKIEIWKVIEPKTYEMKSLYESKFPAFGRPTGQILIKFAINSKGIVFADSIKRNDFKDSSFVKGIEQIITKAKFKDISGNYPNDITEIVFPFIFKE
jgi:hypothetical protein